MYILGICSFRAFDAACQWKCDSGGFLYFFESSFQQKFYPGWSVNDKKQICLHLPEICGFYKYVGEGGAVCVGARAPLCIFLCDSRGCNWHDSAAAGKELGGPPCESSPHLLELTALRTIRTNLTTHIQQDARCLSRPLLVFTYT